MTHVKKLKLVDRRGQGVECMVELEVNLGRLITYLGTKALRNRSQRSTDVHGMVQAKVRPVTQAA